MSKSIRIVTGSRIDIQRIAALLEENQIPSLIKDNMESAQLAGFGALQDDIELHVSDDDVEEAQKIIEAFYDNLGTEN